MKRIIVKRQNGDRIADRVHLAKSFLRRAIGLMGRKSLEDDEGMLFVPGGSIHTVGMRMSIDVAFLDREYCVLKTRANLGPFRSCIAPRGTRYTLELAPGVLEKKGLAIGDKLNTVAHDD